MKKIINIHGRDFEYEAACLSYDTVDAISFDKARGVFVMAKKMLDSKGIRFVLAFGTLLGAIREHSFISHDYDVDIYTDQYDELLEAIPEFYAGGFKLCRAQDKRLYSFMWDGVYVDIYIKGIAPQPWGLYCDFIGSAVIPKKYSRELITIDFLGMDVLVPKRHEELLEFFYGKTWRTPIKGGKAHYAVRSFEIFRNCREFIRKLFSKQ